MVTDVLIFLVGAIIGWSAPQYAVVKRASAWAEGKAAMLWGKFF